MTRSPTLADVALLAEVSLKTASRALNGERYVAESTRARVVRAAAELHFEINAAASQLKRGAVEGNIGLVIGDLENPFSMAIAKGAESALRGADRRLLIASSDEDPATERSVLDELATRRVSGILLVSTLSAHSELNAYVDRGIRIVFVDRAPVGVEADSFVLDNTGGTAAAVRSLLAAGHERIAFIGDHARLSPQIERRAAFEAEMRAASLPIDPALMVTGAHDAVEAASAIASLLSMKNPPTALFAANNRATVGAIMGIRRAQTPPAIIGFDDFELAEALGITTVSSDVNAMGAMAAMRLLESRAPGSPGHRTVIPARLVARGSGERSPAS